VSQTRGGYGGRPAPVPFPEYVPPPPPLTEEELKKARKAAKAESKRWIEQQEKLAQQSVAQATRDRRNKEPSPSSRCRAEALVGDKARQGRWGAETVDAIARGKQVREHYDDVDARWQAAMRPPEKKGPVFLTDDDAYSDRPWYKPPGQPRGRAISLFEED
jgi:hypothetical protein